MIPFRTKRTALQLQYLSSALFGAAIFVGIGGLVLTTTDAGLLRVAMFALGFGVSAGLVYGASVWLFGTSKGRQEAQDNDRTAMP